MDVRFSPILYELWQGILRSEDPQLILVEQGKGESVHLDLEEYSAIPSLYSTSTYRHSIPTPGLSLSLIVALSPIFLGGLSTLLTLHWRYVLPMLEGQYREHKPPPLEQACHERVILLIKSNRSLLRFVT